MSGRDNFTQVAENTPFDNSSNGFTSDDTQSAIEEAKQYAEGFPRAGIRGIYNGTSGNNDWLGPNELTSNTPFLTSPVVLKINEISWANQNTDVQFHLEFRIGSKTGTVFHTLTVTSPNGGSGYETGINYTINPGDTVWIQYKDDGQNASDLEVTLWLSRIP